jgi:hypothetical protein
MPGPVGVVATVGEDRGLTPEERVERSRVEKWTRVLEAAKQRLVRIEHKSATANEATQARLQIKAQQTREEIARAERELSGAVN